MSPTTSKRGAPYGNHNALRHGRYAKSTPKQRRGAPAGNRNAFCHGFYSKTFSKAENKSFEIEGQNEFMDEITLARVNAARVAARLKNHQLSDIDFVNLSNGLIKYLNCIRSLNRDYHYVYRNSTPLQAILEELRKIPPEID